MYKNANIFGDNLSLKFFHAYIRKQATHTYTHTHTQKKILKLKQKHC